jgi:hypothetical protein
MFGKSNNAAELWAKQNKPNNAIFWKDEAIFVIEIVIARTDIILIF